ncbi:MAG TPA: A/G-specific adenine glycosylase [Candidatus Eisenbacteria bacterium]|nr:A/G-specific adenine glycosylase [Candidatus Eisenbacteria bacterium]
MPLANRSWFRCRLLRWYRRNRRDLPWRRLKDPYAIWIAETMLQQTQVQTALPYYERFLSALPTVSALDRAPLRKVLALWSGLGYYRRAESLKRAARLLVRNHNGELPASYESLKALPGIGDYTAGALMSIAFGAPYPAIDGNARRVLSRVFGVSSPPEIQRIARAIVPRARPGDFNQALMELGATMCVSHKPKCNFCPVAMGCRARRHFSGAASLKLALTNQEGEGFTPRRRPPPRAVHWPVAIIRAHDKLLLRKRPRNGLLGGLWEFPGGERAKHESIETALTRHLGALVGSVRPEGVVGTVRHTITNRRIWVTVLRFSRVGKPTRNLPNARWRWVNPAFFDAYPVSAMTRKVFLLLQAHEKSAG